MQLLWLLAVAILPPASTAVGLGLCRMDDRRRAPAMPGPAGPWIERRIARDRARLGPVRVEVVSADVPDAYWPNTRTLGLSEATWGGSRPKDWAIAAHELGHAVNLDRHPVAAWLLPGARLVAGLGWRICVAGAVAAALFAEPAAIGVAAVAGILSVAASAVVCADELAASGFALRLLTEDPTVSPDARRRAATAMAAAASAYLLGAAAQLAVLLAWPVIARSVVGEPFATRDPSHLGIWLILATTPVVVVRAALDVAQVVAPEPVPSELDLWALLGREATGEAACALGVVGVVAALRTAVGGPEIAVASAFATAVAL
ncbi:MAG: zinc metallopeptidase, partial [Myxococcota bacterium]